MNILNESINFFLRLSDELVLKILTYVPKGNFRNITLVDRRFNRISRDPSLWQQVRIFHIPQ